MHFEPGTVHEGPLQETDLDELDEQYSGEEESRPPRRREGLPSSYRMRHQRHYVEQLMGDGPIRTVREIAIADIQPTPESDANISGLEESIRRVGVLEPLLVCEQAGRYHVIAGVNRLRAARNVGLRSVPCLVHQVDEEMVKAMREAVSERATEPRAGVVAVDRVPEQPSVPGALPPAFADVTAGLRFVSSLMPALDAAGDDRLRRSVLMDLAGIELRRARIVAAAAEALAGARVPARAETECGELVAGVADALSAEARLRGVTLDVSRSEGGRVPLDHELARIAVTGLVQAVMNMLDPGATVRILAEVTAIRPAFILGIEQDAKRLTPEDLRRFFDAEWPEHPAGPAGALLLAAAVRIARLHGGRADVQAMGEGCRVTFVIPKPVEG